jgi:hypothetical protein
MKRDQYLPAPEVCDWLIAQEWSPPSTIYVQSAHVKSEIYECSEALVELGRDHCARFLLPAESIAMLREDQRARLGGLPDGLE